MTRFKMLTMLRRAAGALGLALALPLAVMAQDVGHRLPCITHSLSDSSLAANPHLRPAVERLERMSQIMQSRSAQRSGPGIEDPRDGVPLNIDDSVLIIPIVVHIIHDNGPENISTAQVVDAIRILNEDFNQGARDTSQISAAFWPINERPRFEFRLARLDPQGNCTVGINRIQSTLTTIGNDQLKTLIHWPSDRYVNIYVSRVANGAGGYTYLPGNTPPSNEGIVCLFTQFGSIGASGGGNFAARTLTHEMGHYFNLPHTWGPTNTPGVVSNCNFDDGVADTPNTVGTSTQGCPLSQVSCGSLDNVENYLDYSNCARMFTQGQCARMRAAAYNTRFTRRNLWQAANLMVTGVRGPALASVCVPLPTINVATQRICAGDAVQLNATIDNVLSLNEVQSFEWLLPGATPSTSSSLNPRVTYNTPGVYSISLTATNSAGGRTATLNRAITVIAAEAAYALNELEGFETPQFPLVTPGDSSKSWDVSPSWSRVQIGPATGIGVMRNLLSAIGQDPDRTLVSPGFDMRGIQGPVFLQFKMAAAARTGQATDRLWVAFSVDCGRTWTNRLLRQPGGPVSIYTRTSLVSGTFLPDPSEYRQESINISNFIGQPSLRVRFQHLRDVLGGNALFIDDVVVTNQTSLRQPVVLGQQGALSLYPNPATGQVQVLGLEGAALPAQGLPWQLLDPTGRVLSQGRLRSASDVIPLTGLTPGLYQARLSGPAGTQALPVVVR